MNTYAYPKPIPCLAMFRTAVLKHTYKSRIFVQAQVHKLLEGLGEFTVEAGWGVFGDVEEDSHGVHV